MVRVQTSSTCTLLLWRARILKNIDSYIYIYICLCGLSDPRPLKMYVVSLIFFKTYHLTVWSHTPGVLYGSGEPGGTNPVVAPWGSCDTWPRQWSTPAATRRLGGWSKGSGHRAWCGETDKTETTLDIYIYIFAAPQSLAGRKAANTEDLGCLWNNLGWPWVLILVLTWEYLQVWRLVKTENVAKRMINNLYQTEDVKSQAGTSLLNCA